MKIVNCTKATTYVRRKGRKAGCVRTPYGAAAWSSIDIIHSAYFYVRELEDTQIESNDVSFEMF